MSVRNLILGSAIVMAFAAAAPLRAAPSADTAAGETLFKQRCQMCHAIAAGRVSPLGPNLSGVAGRKAASVPAFAYSPALKASGLVWTPANLDRFLAGPTKLVPGTRMAVSLADAKQRAALVAYLASTH